MEEYEACAEDHRSTKLVTIQSVGNPPWPPRNNNKLSNIPMSFFAYPPFISFRYSLAKF
jgi:hypothetical protein